MNAQEEEEKAEKETGDLEVPDVETLEKFEKLDLEKSEIPLPTEVCTLVG